MARNNFFESSNPIMNEDTFAQQRDENGMIINEHQDLMTVSGAVNKTLLLFSIMMITTAVSFFMPTTFLMWTGIIGGLIAVLVASFKPHTSPVSAPVYALFEGLFLGSISAFFASAYDGIVLQAVTLTFGTLLMMLLLYKSGLITVTQKFRSGVMMATGAIFIFYLISIVMSFFGATMPLLHDNGIMGIGLSVVILAVASLNLLLDFDMFERGEREGAPAYMEWYAGLGLLVTLVWLYVEFLRLLSKLRD